MDRIIHKVEPCVSKLPAKKCVAAYARVSSGKDAMIHSLSAQISYYSDYIQKHRGWEYAGVYADEAMTGTKNDRPEFQRLLTDCRNGNIDMVITKSISRFARNTVTMLETVRELKDLNVDVYFEKENIHSISGDGELMLTILASFAQEESRSVSENCKWRVRTRFQNGMPQNTTMLGYRYFDGVLTVEPQEAEVVRSIFSDFLSGMGKEQIMKKLNAACISTRFGNAWGKSSVDEVLRNIAYTGNLILQTTYISDHLAKQTRKNNGELPMYFVESSHEPIIAKVTFDAVQAELARRAAKYHSKPKTPTTYPFTGMIVCGRCGKHYRRKITAKRAVWICTTFNTFGKNACPSQQIPEDILTKETNIVLGISDFDENIFKSKIQQIQVPEANTLIFIFDGGTAVERHWAHKSRKETWREKLCRQQEQ
jgi:DNA invertase Pin-like site-specific DNA recombinase